jgi:hypothetical protein
MLDRYLSSPHMLTTGRVALVWAIFCVMVSLAQLVLRLMPKGHPARVFYLGLLEGAPCGWRDLPDVAGFRQDGGDETPSAPHRSSVATP